MSSRTRSTTSRWLPASRRADVAKASTSTHFAATGLAHILVLTTPRPEAFFSWIVGLATFAGVAISLGSPGSWADRFATALVNLVIGLCILSLVRSLIGRATTQVLPGPWRAPGEYGPITPPPDLR